MRHQNVWLTLSFFSVFVVVLFCGGQANAETWSYSHTHNGLTLSEVLKFESPDARTTEHYEGPQTAAALMAAFDAAYTEASPKTTVTVSRQGKRADIKSEWTEAEIDARYPRAEWLQMLLDKGITITRFGDYAMYLSKRHTLALLKDNPKLWKSGILGLPRTKDWHTFKEAYLNNGWLVHHERIREAEASVAAAKEQVERALELIPAVPDLFPTPAMPTMPAVPVPPHLLQEVDEIEQLIERFKEALESGKIAPDIGVARDGQLTRAKARVERAKQQLKRAEAQVERSLRQLKRAQEALERERKRTSPPSPKREPKQDSKEGTL